MQSGIHKEVDFIELDDKAEVELRVQDDCKAELCVDSECAKTAGSTTESSATEGSATEGSATEAESEVTAEHANMPAAPPRSQAGTSVQSYTEFSEKFGRYNNAAGQAKTVWHQWKQHFNFVYFSVSAVSIATVSIVWHFPVLWVASAIFIFFGLAAFRAGWNRRMHPKDFAVTLSARTKTALRVTALVFPIPFLMWVFIAQPISYQQLHRGREFFNDRNFQEAANRFNRATMLNPSLERAFAEAANNYNYNHEYDKSLVEADKALQLDPTDGAAWASKAWALNNQFKYSEALPAALLSVEFAPQNGQAQHDLADAYYALGDYEKALAPATKHIEIHYTEPGALYLRAKILDKLNRGDEAAQDRAAAAALGTQESE